MTRGAMDPVRKQPTGTPTTQPVGTAASASPTFNTVFDDEITNLDRANPEAVEDLLSRMNQAIVGNQTSLDAENKAANAGQPAPNQDQLGIQGKNLGKARLNVQQQQFRR